MPVQQELKEVIKKVDDVAQKGGLPIIIFDLDSTLFSTAPRNLRIVREFASDFATQFPKFTEVAKNLSLTNFEKTWNISDVLIEHGIDPAHESLKAVQDYWEVHFFSDEYVSLDLPTPGAPEFVRDCHEQGALVYYLTGRHVSRTVIEKSDAACTISKVLKITPGMEFGTARAITERGFPFWQGRCELHLKPNFEMNDATFKDVALKLIKSLNGEVVATFDNQPANCRVFKENFPLAMNFWLETVWDPTDPMPTENEAFITIGDFV